MFLTQYRIHKLEILVLTLPRVYLLLRVPQTRADNPVQWLSPGLSYTASGARGFLQ